MEDYNNELENGKNLFSDEEFKQKILNNQKKSHNLSIVIILLLSAIIVIRLFVIGY